MQTETVAGFRLSPHQEQLWIEQLGTAAYRASAVVALSGRLDESALKEALGKVVARHEILRTTFHRRPGLPMPLQVIGELLPPAWSFADVSEHGESASAKAADLLAEEARRPFDLESGPLVRASLVSLGGERRLLALSLPSLIADAVSVKNLIGELIHIYAGKEGELPPEPIQYADFSEWANELSTSVDEDGRAGKAFWQERAAFTAPPLPFELGAGREGALDPGAVTVSLDEAVVDRLARAARDQGAREGTAAVAVGLFAVFQVLMARLSGQTEFVISYLLDGREEEEAKSAIGLYARYAPIPWSFDGAPLLSEVLRKAVATIDDAAKWQGYLPASTVSTGIVGFELFEPSPEVEARGVRFSPADASFHLGRFCAKLSVLRFNEGTRARLFYDRRVLRDEDAARAARSFEILAASAAADAGAEALRLAMVSEEERRLLLSFSKSPSEAARPGCLHHLFEEQARRTKDRPALVSADRVLTYAELNARANQLAHRLRKHGVSADTTVGLCVERGAEMIIGLLAILKAGGAYVPLLPDHPRQRLAHKIADVAARVLITQEKHLGNLPAFGGHTLCLDRDSALLDAESEANPEPLAGPESLAYVIYTSGSTGHPKGVAVAHKNLVNYTHALCQRLNLGAEPGGLTFATVSTIAADLGNTCVFPALVSGGCLHVIRQEVSMDGGLFSDYTEKHAIDVLKITPSHLHALLDGAGEGRSVLPRKYLITGGEASTWEQSARIRAKGSCVHINHYGPTETTIGSLTYGPVKDDDPGARFARTVPIGRPIAGTEIHIVDAHLSPVPLGAPGELLIGGAGLSRGYHQQPEHTAERFIKNPFSTDPEARLYRTGDRARYLPDGNVEFLGRVDQQVKVRGFRVEPAEIEGVLLQDPRVRQAIVIPREEKPGDARLVAYVVAAKNPAPSASELRAALEMHLPEYMIPSIFVSLSALPLTLNGKVDRKALPAPEKARQIDATFVAPRSPTEEKIASIWADVLRIERLGVNDNFFDLGGHSLLGTQVISRVQKDFELLELRLSSLFDRPTVAEMARVVDELLACRQAEMDSILADVAGMSEEEAAALLAEERQA